MDVYQRRRLVAALSVIGVVVVIIVAIASAGGDDDEGDVAPVEEVPGSDDSTSKAAYIRQADAICAEANAAIANLEVGSAADDPELLAQQQYEYARSELDQLQTLERPNGDATDLNQFFTAFRAQLDVLQKQQVATERADDTALAEVSTELPAAQADLRRAAANFGFEDCGKEGSPTGTVDSTDTGADTGTAVPPPAPAPTDTPAAPIEPAETPITPEVPAAPQADSGGTAEAPPPAETGGGTTEPSAGGGTGTGGTGTGDTGGISP